MEPAVAERRKHPRVAAVESSWRAVRLRTGDPLSLVNLGADGALVESSRQLLPGTFVVLQVSMDQGTLTLRAEVIRCAVYALRSDGIRYRGGLTFQAREGHHR